MTTYKQLLDISNATVVAMGKSMLNMGLNIPLVWNECAHAFENSAKNLLKDAGLEIEGSDVKSVAEDFTKKILRWLRFLPGDGRDGLCHRG